MSTEQQTPARRRRGRRSVLLTIMTLGAVVSLTAANGVFAVFTDRATTGTNSAGSRGENRSADIQIAEGGFTGDVVSCSTFVEDLATGIITATDMVPLGNGVHAYICLKNVGSRSVDVTASAIDVVDTDNACTGDEASLDTTCGDDQAGELSGHLQVFLTSRVCGELGGESLGNTNLALMTSTPFALFSIAPGATNCLELEVDDQAQQDDVTISQSDTSTWKFAFDATAT